MHTVIGYVTYFGQKVKTLRSNCRFDLRRELQRSFYDVLEQFLPIKLIMSTVLLTYLLHKKVAGLPTFRIELLQGGTSPQPCRDRLF
jgi:hypothetical protein